MELLFLIISVVIGCISRGVGIWSILRGEFRPQRTTRLLLLVVSVIIMGTLLAQGDRNAIYIVFVIFIGNLIMFLLSIKRGIGGTTKFDILVLSMTLVTLTVWVMTNNPVLGLLMAIITNFIAFLPTIIKSWNLPQTEEWRVYALYALASLFTVLSISNFTFGKTLTPIYAIGINGTVASIILLRKKKVNR